MFCTKEQLIGFAVTVALLAPSSHAAIFSGPAFFSVQPSTQMGTPVNNLNIFTLNPLGYNVAGQFIVNVPAGPVSGTLLHYVVKRPLDPSFGSQFLNIKQFLIGFSQPPSGGTYGNSSGFCRTYLDVGGQVVNSNLTLTNGAQTWNWGPQSPNFTYTSGTDAFLVQEFDLDGVKLGGAAGQWIVDLPVESFFEIVPAPSSLAALGLGMLCVSRRRR